MVQVFQRWGLFRWCHGEKLHVKFAQGEKMGGCITHIYFCKVLKLISAEICNLDTNYALLPRCNFIYDLNEQD